MLAASLLLVCFAQSAPEGTQITEFGLPQTGPYYIYDVSIGAEGPLLRAHAVAPTQGFQKAQAYEYLTLGLGGVEQALARTHVGQVSDVDMQSAPLVDVEMGRHYVCTSRIGHLAPIDSEVVAFAADAQTGNILWKTDLPQANYTHGVRFQYFRADRRELFCGTGRTFEGMVWCLDSDTGAIKWSTEVDSELIHGCVTGDAVVFSVINSTSSGDPPDFGFQALDLDDGSLLWESERLPGHIASIKQSADKALVAATVVHNPAFYGGPGHRVALLDTATGAFLWDQPTGYPSHGLRPAIEFGSNPDVVLASFLRIEAGLPYDPGATLQAFDLGTGAIVWERVSIAASEHMTSQTRGPQLSATGRGTCAWSHAEFDPSGKRVRHLEIFDVGTGATLAETTDEGGAAGVAHYRTIHWGQDGSVVAVTKDLKAGQVPNSLPADYLLRAFDAETLEFQWERPLEPEGPVSGFVGAATCSPEGESLYFLHRNLASPSQPSELTKAAAPSGDQLWSIQLEPAAAMPRQVTASQDFVVLTHAAYATSISGAQSVSAYDPIDGTHLWSKDIGAVQPAAGSFTMSLTEGSEPKNEDGRRSTILAGNTIVALTQYVASDGAMDQLDAVGLAAANGEELWRLPLMSDPFDFPRAPWAVGFDGTYAYVARMQASGATWHFEILRLQPETGEILGATSLPDEREVLAICAKPEGVLALIYDSYWPPKTAEPHLLGPLGVGIVASGFAEASSVRRLGPLDGFLLVHADSISQVGDVLEFGEDPTTSDWIAPAVVEEGDIWQVTSGGDLIVRTSMHEPQPYIFSLDAITGFDASDGHLLWADVPLQPEDQPHFDYVVADSGGEQWAAVIADQLAHEELLTESQYALRVVHAQAPSLYLEPDVLSVATGGQLDLRLRGEELPGPEQGAYLAIAASDLAQPGLAWDGVVLPIDPTDPLVWVSILQANQGAFHDTLGLLDHAGNAEASIVVPAGALDPVLAGEELHLLWIRFSAQLAGYAEFASHPVALQLF